MKTKRKIIIASILFILIMSAFAFKPAGNGKIIMIVSVEVKNLAEWKKAFDSGAPMREKAGIKVINVCSSVENENHVVVIEEAKNAEAANNFSDLLKSKQKNGEMSKLEIKLYNEEN